MKDITIREVSFDRFRLSSNTEKGKSFLSAFTLSNQILSKLELDNLFKEIRFLYSREGFTYELVELSEFR
jgi:hypothetical protein